LQSKQQAEANHLLGCCHTYTYISVSQLHWQKENQMQSTGWIASFEMHLKNSSPLWRQKTAD